MPKIKNKLFQPVMVVVSSDKSLFFQSRAEKVVTNADMDSSHLKSLLAGGVVTVQESGAKGSSSTKKKPSAKKKASAKKATASKKKSTTKKKR